MSPFFDADALRADRTSDRELLFGDDSRLGRLVRSGGAPAEVAEQLRSLRDHPRLAAYLRAAQGYAESDAKSVLQGWIAIFECLQILSAGISAGVHDRVFEAPTRETDAGRLDARFADACQWFDQVWGEPRQADARGSRPAFVDELDGISGWRPAWESPRLDMTRAGFWIAYNALRDLAHGPRNAPPSGSATTPILVEHGVFGRVVWLSVELLPDQPPGFDPDPRYLGLMAIEARGAEAFAASMRSVWRKVWDGSELGNGRWRGRWRIQDRCPLASQRFANRSPAYFSRLRGRSAEASAAIALWAAAGRIPDDPPYVRPEGSFALLPEVAISASLAEPVPGEPLVALKLEPVDAAPAKRRAATDAALDLVIFADDRPVAERHAARAGPQPSHSIGSTRFEGRATLSGALREMLAVQRRLHHWHERRHAAWMKTSDGRDRWAPGTADLDAM